MIALIAASMLQSQVSAYGPVPTPRQLDWHRSQYAAFVHFGPNTFTGVEWGTGKEPAEVFNPTQLSTDQWCETFKKAGMKIVVITAKHHDGFCLWPSKLSSHTVTKSPWRAGKGDVLAELSKSCAKFGLKMGVYLSPWDRNHPAYGTPRYNQVFSGMLKEVLTQYGEIHEVWFDGANGEGPNGKRQEYDWPLFISTVREFAPKAVIFSDAGPDIRWVGNEQGKAALTNWSRLNRDEFEPGTSKSDQLTEGHEKGTHWVPAECDVSIRPGWFWRAAENDKVKSLAALKEIWYASVGQNANLLLNVPPDTRGLIHEKDVAALLELRKYLDATYSTDLAKGAKVTTDSELSPAFGGRNLTDGKEDTAWVADSGRNSGNLSIDLGKVKRFDRVFMAEDVRLGQRVKRYSIYAEIAPDVWEPVATGTTIGHNRLHAFAPVLARRIRIDIQDALAQPTLASFGVYASPEVSRETLAERDQRMAWFREARFGMFIHWGLYSIPAGTWAGKQYGGASEWLMNTANVKAADWMPLIERFNPVKYNAREWVKIAKAAGMKYIVITSKHHEGFALWDSKVSSFDIGGTPYKKDLLKPLAEACKAEGIRLCFYHSIMDWTHPDYLPRRSWDPRPGGNMDSYVKFLKAQLKELLTNYGPLGILWFDGEWESTWNHERGKDLDAFVRKLQPKIIVNNRVDVGRNGMQGFSMGEQFAGDYGTPEQEIPAQGIPGLDWESCMTMNGSWGFHAGDLNWKSSETLIRNLIDCASKGGNYLLNVGPTAEGELPAASVSRLKDVGAWLSKNGTAIYGTQAGPFKRTPWWGRVTRRKNRLYLHVFNAPNGRVVLEGLKTKVLSARRLGGETVPIAHITDGWLIETRNVEGPATVYEVDLDGPPVVEAVAAKLDPQGKLALQAVDAVVTGSARFEADKECIGFWVRQEDQVSWDVALPAGTYRIEAIVACTPEDAGSRFYVQVGKSQIQADVPATKGWSDFVSVDLGKLTVKAQSDKVLVGAVKKKSNGLMNLRQIRIVKVD